MIDKKLALFLILVSNNWNPEPQSPEISIKVPYSEKEGR
jgi:hypothetical protein